MKAEKERITGIFDRVSKENINMNSEKFPAIAKEYGFEHVRTEDTGSFILKDMETQKYFRVRSREEFEEIERP